MSSIVALYAGTSGATALAPGQAIQACNPFLVRQLPRFLNLINVFLHRSESAFGLLMTTLIVLAQCESSNCEIVARSAEDQQ